VSAQQPGSGPVGSGTGGRRLRFDPEDPVLARAAWSRLVEPTDLVAYRALAAHGPVPLLLALLSGRAGPPRWRVRLPDLDPVRDLATVRRLGGRLLIPGDAEWPPQLFDLAAEKQPICLWLRGPLPLAPACARSAAVVGSRAMSSYGEQVAAAMGSGCADRGITVVSGAAYGIDGAAHRGALSAGGPTVAVLACGVDRWYPPGHGRLLDRIVAQGAVISEIPPGSAPSRWRFLERNRLIAALSSGTVVVEAAWRSGALATAARAAELSRPLGAVPGPVTVSTSAGCHRLLRDGATCVCDAAELAELIGRIGTDLAPEPKAADRPGDDLLPDRRQVLDSLPVRRPAGVESIARACGLDQPLVQAALAELAVLGLAVAEGVGWRRAGPRDAPGGRRAGA
jgi:DNA processing protein